MSEYMVLSVSATSCCQMAFQQIDRRPRYLFASIEQRVCLAWWWDWWQMWRELWRANARTSSTPMLSCHLPDTR